MPPQVSTTAPGAMTPTGGSNVVPEAPIAPPVAAAAVLPPSPAAATLSNATHGRLVFRHKSPAGALYSHRRKKVQSVTVQEEEKGVR